jgi:branched-chain amino acid transport system substrate-binding protein
VKGVIATWNHPYSKWNPADVTTHEAFRREQAVMGMVQDGRVVFGNAADKARLIKEAAGTTPAKAKGKIGTKK